MTLDGIKTGMSVLPEVLRRDTSKYQKRPPLWKETDEDKDKFQRTSSNEKNVTRPDRLGCFIMDDLHKQAHIEGETRLKQLEEFFNTNWFRKLDDDLAAPWNNAMELAELKKKDLKETSMAEALGLIKKHVETVYDEHRIELSSPKKASKASPKKSGAGASFTNLPIEVRQDTIRQLSKKFVSFPKPRNVYMLEEEVARLRASYAYIYDHTKRCGNYTRFPFDVAMRELCAIKARAIGNGVFKTVAGDFYEHFNLKHPKKHHI